MLINKDKDEIVLIPPKTGTMSIADFLLNELPIKSRFNNLLNGHSHNTINNLTDSEINELKKIYITTREPLKRFESTFNFLMQGVLKGKKIRAHGVNKYKEMKTLDINVFTKELYNLVNGEYENIDAFTKEPKVFNDFCVGLGIPEDTIPKYGKIIFKSQYNFIKDVDKKEEVILLKLESIKKIGLDSLFKIFIDYVEPPNLIEGVKFSDKYFKNKSRVHNKRNILSDESKILIKELYKEDFDFLGY